MHQFHCKAVEGKIVPLQPNKILFLEKLLKSYEELNKNFKVTIEVIEKNINSEQESLYKAFITKASNHFGNTYQEMENILKRFWPLNSFHMRDYKPREKWTTTELNLFIEQSSALLAEHGFTFQ